MVAFNVCIQAFFVVLVARNVLTLDYSLLFAVLGIPACILAIILAIRGNGSWRLGATISPSIGLMMLPHYSVPLSSRAASDIAKVITRYPSGATAGSALVVEVFV